MKPPVVFRALPDIPLPAEWARGPVCSQAEEVIQSLTNPWSVSPAAARVLVRLMVQEQLTRVLEFGAGMSSRIFAAAIQEAGGGALVSVEEDPAWCTEAWAHVRNSLGTDATLIKAGLRLTADRRGLYFGFREQPLIEKNGPYDLVFIDAPWGGYGRDGSLHAAINSVRLGGLIVLDDAGRAGEQHTVRRWIMNYPELHLIANDPEVGRGLAVLRKTGDGAPPRFSGKFLAEVWLGGAYDLLRAGRAIWKHKRQRKDIDCAG